MAVNPAPGVCARCGAPRHVQTGVGLIEVLIAVLVLAIGILGIAASQMRALVGSGNAVGHSMATVALYSIVDAMTADRIAARSGAYNGTVTANACPSAGTLAQTQLKVWCDALATNLGAEAATQGTVACGATGACNITITWNDARTETGAGGGTQTLTTAVQLPVP